jgi:hypothetical protein
MSYYDDNNQIIKATINKLYNECRNSDYIILTSEILNYFINGMNYVFNENYEIVIETIKNKLRRLLRLEFLIDVIPNINNLQPNQQLEDVKLLVDEEEIEKIPKIIYKDLESEIKQKNTSCIICNEDYQNEDMIRKLKCCHIYHMECIDKWLKEYSYKCPFCRSEAAPHKPMINP